MGQAGVLPPPPCGLPDQWLLSQGEQKWTAFNRQHTGSNTKHTPWVFKKKGQFSLNGQFWIKNELTRNIWAHFTVDFHSQIWNCQCAVFKNGKLGEGINSPPNTTCRVPANYIHLMPIRPVMEISDGPRLPSFPASMLSEIIMVIAMKHENGREVKQKEREPSSLFFFLEERKNAIALCQKVCYMTQLCSAEGHFMCTLISICQAGWAI